MLSGSRYNMGTVFVIPYIQTEVYLACSHPSMAVGRM